MTVAQLLVCHLGAQRVAWPVDAVVEVVRAVAITRLPGAPPALEGVINVRGALVPVLDLRARFGLATPPLDPDEQMVLVRAGARTVACRVDRVDGLLELPEGAVAAPHGLTAATRGLAGVAPTGDGVAVVYDPNAFLAEQEARALEAALDGARVDARPAAG